MQNKPIQIRKKKITLCILYDNGAIKPKIDSTRISSKTQTHGNETMSYRMMIVLEKKSINKNL